MNFSELFSEYKSDSLSCCYNVDKKQLDQKF